METIFVFVGERPSEKAARIGATWQNGKLAGKTLRETLLVLGIEPDKQTYLNLWKNPHESEADRTHEQDALATVQSLQASGRHCVVALGAKVSRFLSREGVTHLQLIHPAARGAIRKKERYHAHVESILKGKI